MCKDEADVIERTLLHVAAQGVDGILIADNMSTDGTLQLLDEIESPCPVMVSTDTEVGYWQSAKMTALAAEAHREYGAEWVWPFDADEVWVQDAGLRIADVCEMSIATIITANLFHHLVTLLDPPGHPFDSMGYRVAEPAPIPKVIVRWQPGNVLHAGNHGCSEAYPGGVQEPVGVEVRHFPYRSEDQFVRKAINGSRAYAETTLPWEVGQHWREYGLLYERGGEEALREAFRVHFVHDLPSASGLVYDPVRTLP
jgi:glycosyltransferase involved in cell wall biosynthesis